MKRTVFLILITCGLILTACKNTEKKGTETEIVNDDSSETIQTITLLKSDQIQKELNEKGKAILHINFDIDKATLKSDGEQAVAEIVKTLQTDKNLKIAIHGYTDNVGNESHNLELSKARANTVLKTITEAGVEKSRLTADGFGSQNPIADNSTEEGKSQNRRVELVKK